MHCALVGGTYDFGVIPSLNWIIEFGTALGLRFGLGIGGLDLGLGLDNSIQFNFTDDI